MRFLAITILSLAVLSGVSHADMVGVTIDYVTVGNLGNLADGPTGDGTIYGAVSYAYQIAKSETTISQYAVFLNAVASTDTYGLYSSGMALSFINGITQSGSSGNFIYTVNPGSENKPITYVSWFDAARFTNWLHHGQPTGAQDNTTTEDGAYTLNGAISGVSVSKNVGAAVWIPSEDEWYKAAYYDPNKGGVGVGGYWLHANQSDTMTTNDIGVAGAANYSDANGYTTFTGGLSWGITDVGAYGLNSDSAYGTDDQTGNVREWNDAVISGSARGLRGGSWLYDVNSLSSVSRDSGDPSYEDYSIGFRVASVPEPTSFLLTVLAGGVMLIRRRR